MLQVKGLTVKAGGKKILKGINLSLKRGETHFLIGPNGAGKSTLGSVLMGHPNYKIKKGSIVFRNKNLALLSPDKRAQLGLFLAFQHSLEFEGVKIFNFLRQAKSKLSKGGPNIAAFQKELLGNLNKLGLKESFAERYLNYGFSGGEKKKSEVLQLLSLKPKLVILDETDSGLDIDSLKQVSRAIVRLKKQEKISFLVITHLSRIARYLKPDFVHIMVDGKIVRSGDRHLINRVEKHGYKNF